ncbi:hypothetical protein TNCV_4358441 [Trichonephila clavipes]|nr:hypothetical protein TNCV_4358441 [Trichonephila clavipes]
MGQVNDELALPRQRKEKESHNRLNVTAGLKWHRQKVRPLTIAVIRRKTFDGLVEIYEKHPRFFISIASTDCGNTSS